MTITLPSEDSEVYLVDGRPVRRWHTVLREAGLAPVLPTHPGAMRNMINAKHRGKQIHDALPYILRGRYYELDLTQVADESLPYLQALLEWFGAGFNGLRPPVQIEQPLYCADLDFCCTPDFHDAISVNDLKTSYDCSPLWGLQLAAQALAHGSTALERRVVWLHPKKPKSYEVCTPASHPKVFSEHDFDVVRELCGGVYDGPAVRAWKDGHARNGAATRRDSSDAVREPSGR